MKNKKTTPPSHPERKNQGPSAQVHAEPSHWELEISIFKTVHRHFWPGLMAGSVIWGHSLGWPDIVSSPSFLADFQRKNISTYVTRTLKNSTLNF
jgi:hypothetical protein